MKEKRRFATNMISQVLTFAINLSINFFLSRQIVNVIGKEVYGFVGLANNFTSYIQVFTVAFNAMLSRYVTIKIAQKEYDSASVYLSTITICNIVVSIILFIPSVLLCCFLEYVVDVPRTYLNDIKILWFFIFLAFLISLATNTFQTCFFATNRLDLSAKRSLENYILRAIILVVFFALFQPRIWYVGVASIVCASFLAVLNACYLKKLTPQLRIERRFFSLPVIRELFGIGIWNSINQLSQLLLTGFDLLIANLLIGSSEMGLLSIAKTIPTQLLAFIGTVSNVFLPRMTITYAEGNQDAFIAETSFAMKVCGALCSVPIVGFIAFGQPFFSLWMKSLTLQDISQIQILSILTLLPTVFSVYVYPLYSVNTITCKLKVPVLVSTGIGGVSIGLVYLILKLTNWGIYAVAGVSSVFLLFRVLIFVPVYAANNLRAPVGTFYPTLLKGIVSNIIMIGMFYGMRNIFSVRNWVQLVLVAVVGGIIGYTVNFIVIFSKEEKIKILSIIRRKSRHKN